MPNPDYYQTLELDPKATDEQIWLSYHKLEFLYSRGRLDGGVGKFLLADEAYRILIDKQARESYDRWYRALARHQEEVRNFKSLLVTFLASFLAAGIVAFGLGLGSRLTLSGTGAYSVLFAILLVAMFVYRNKLKNYSL